MKNKLLQITRLTFVRLVTPLALAALLFTGCVVTSVYPFYQAKDVTFDPALLGTWVDTDSDPGDDSWVFEKIDDRTYKLIVANGTEKTEFDARLFKLGDVMFLDWLPRERPDGGVPMHHLVRVDTISPQLTVRLFKSDWLADHLERNPRAVRHIAVPKPAGEGGSDEIVLTADTKELQRFIRKHLKTADAWSEAEIMRKR